MIGCETKTFPGSRVAGWLPEVINTHQVMAAQDRSILLQPDSNSCGLTCPPVREQKEKRERERERERADTTLGSRPYTHTHTHTLIAAALMM